MKTTKLGQNSKRAAHILKDAKSEYQRLFKAECKAEASKKNPNMPDAAKRAAKRYKKMSWGEALQLASGTKVFEQPKRKPAKKTARKTPKQTAMW